MITIYYIKNKDNRATGYIINAVENNTNINYSYDIKHIKDMRNCLKYCKDYLLSKNINNYAIYKRSIFSMINEWRAHNLLYSLNIQKNRTRHVDLEYPIKWYKQVAYFILSCFYLRY